jgi:hypothetical protein
MATFSPQEVHIPTDGQTEITLSHPYELGKNALTVYLNGILAVPGTDYVEVDQFKIQFLYQLSSQDVVVTQHQVYFSDKLVEVISDTKGLFSRYGTGDRLLNNQKYTAIFNYNGQTFQTTFYTKMSPLFTSLPVIKNDMADAFDSFDEYKLLLQIYLNSVLALNIAGEDQLKEIQDALNNGTQLPYYAKQFVRYRTELDMMLAIYFSLSGRSGVSERKQLGELTVDRSNRFVATMNIEPLLAELKTKVATWEKILRGNKSKSPVRSAVRGGSSNPYPLTSPRRGSWGGSS